MIEEAEPTLGKAADPEKVRRQKVEERLYKRREINDMLFVLSTRQGRRFVYNLLQMAHPLELSFVDRNHDMTTLREGERNIGLKILALLREADASAEVLMQTESKEDTING